jgi:L-fucose mutarotase
MRHVVLKNLDPILSGTLLSVLDGMEPGQWLTLTAGDVAAVGSGPDHTVIDLTSVSTEAAAAAILSVLPLDRSGAPIVYRDNADAADELPDVVFAVCGIAADAELRRVPMSRLDETDFAVLARQSALTVRSHELGDAAAFLLRKGEALLD